ncbi:MAG: hypothetical protein RMJ98_16245 [Myxococcales bacterium]|nr:hypothetical protein [Polyangiaceae bacterium]MDW8250846.1 hypothetical protein [Myxococcales bacterium]
MCFGFSLLLVPLALVPLACGDNPEESMPPAFAGRGGGGRGRTTGGVEAVSPDPMALPGAVAVASLDPVERVELRGEAPPELLDRRKPGQVGRCRAARMHR